MSSLISRSFSAVEGVSMVSVEKKLFQQSYDHVHCLMGRRTKARSDFFATWKNKRIT